MTKEERIKSDPLAQVILQITHAMKIDFGAQYKKQFQTDEDLRQYKRRLYIKLIDSSVSDIIDGYEAYIEAGKVFCPTIPELITNIEAARKKRLQKEANSREVQRVAALPPPKHEINALELLREAKEKKGDDKGDNKSWLERKKLALQNHEAVLFLNWHKFQHGPTGENHRCEYPSCEKIGALSNNTGHGSVYFCAGHYRSS
jgi:hypothetical protein